MQIDWWTLALQAVNFLILVWLLQHFLYKPVMAVIAKRQQATDQLLGDAKAGKEKAEALQQELEGQRAAIGKERDAAMAAAQSAAQGERRVELERAAKEAAQLVAEAHLAIDRDRQQATEALTRHAGEVAVTIARRLLERTPGTAGDEGFLMRLCDRLASRPAEVRRSLLVAGSSETFDVITATALDESARARLRERLGQALGEPAAPTFRVDPALIAGAELHFAHAIMRDNWAHDLARIGKELSGNEHAVEQS